MKNNRCIIDVRTPGEFLTGNAAGSINIPLAEIEKRITEIQQLQQPIILCCASGGRSGQATTLLRSLGINCENGGSWFNIN